MAFVNNNNNRDKDFFDTLNIQKYIYLQLKTTSLYSFSVIYNLKENR